MPPTSNTLFKTLADPTRRALFEHLCQNGEQTVSALTAQSTVSQPAISKHLALLQKAGLVTARPQGRQTHYSATPHALAPLTTWTTQLTADWQSRLNNLEALLNRMAQ